MIQTIKSFFKVKLIVLTLFLVSNSVYASNAKPKTLVAIFGDSITQGYNAANPLPTGNPASRPRVNYALPDRLLTNLLAESCRENLVENWGWGGSSSLNGAQRIRQNLDSSKASYPESDGYTDRYVLILYGTNDLNYKISNADTRAYIEYMIDQSRIRGFKPVVATLIRRLDQPGKVETRNNFIKAAAQTKSAPVVDLYNAFLNDSRWYDGLLDPDLVHPKDAGYELIAQQWFNYLETQVEAKCNSSIISPILLLLLD